MSSIQRIKNVIYGILMLIGGFLILTYQQYGYYLVVFIIDISLLLYGIRMLIYYITMSRFMVGGNTTLYKSIIAIDFGLFAINLDDTPVKIVMIYLIVLMIFNGVLVVLKAIDAKRLDASFWKSKLAYGIVRIIVAVCSIFLWNSQELVTIIYSIVMFHDAIYHIMIAFRKSAIIHIE